jgi:thymidylate synthase (FAD)
MKEHTKDITVSKDFNIKNFFGTVPVLDKGHVELCDGMICDPRLKIVNAARVSFNKEASELSEKDIKLIDFLFKNEHFSTFRHSYFSFRIKAPLLVFRQFWKYQIGCEWVENENIGTIKIPETNWNEVSGRYVEFQPDFYIPKTIRIQSKNNKQGSDGELPALTNGENPVEFFEKSCNIMYDNYKYMVSSGAAKEQARSLLPQNIYSECMWTPSLQCILYVLHQRLKLDAQFEIREYAKAIAKLMLPIVAPLNISKE